MLTLLAAGCDVQEDFWLLRQMRSPPGNVSGATSDLAGLTFLISTSKFVLLAVVMGAEIAGVIDLGRLLFYPTRNFLCRAGKVLCGACHPQSELQKAAAEPLEKVGAKAAEPAGKVDAIAAKPLKETSEKAREFADLIRCERQGLARFGESTAKEKENEKEKESDAEVTTPGTPDEPWVAFVPDNKVGLALSGGGIRSATFNLGLLQGLFDLRVLPIVDYLATVSGGGYIGGWWTCWLKRRPKDLKSLFPVADPGGAAVPELREADAVRHLREFSMFLSPRWGFFEVEMWNGLVAVLSGAIIAMFATACVAFLVFGSWLVCGFALWSTAPCIAAGVLVVLTTAILVLFEMWWQGSDDPEPQTVRLWTPFGFCVLVAVPAILTGLGWCGVETAWDHLGNSALRLLWLKQLDASEVIEQWRRLLWIFSPAAVWFLVAVILVVCRLLFSRKPSSRGYRDFREAIDRVLGRLLGSAAVWSLAGLIWLTARFVDVEGSRILTTGLGALAGGGSFTLLRNWLARSATRPATASPLSKLKRMLPGLLAYVTIALLGVLVGVAVVEILRFPFGLSTVLGVAVLALYLLAALWDSKHFGLHEFYSDRIARSYLGASNKDAPGAIDNRQADRREADDLQLHELCQPEVQRPIHLVCCTANMLADDNLGTLGRGARSAVLSCFGISIGNYWAPRHELRLGSALTASAAAFNSNMGSISRQLGPGVSFLMSALNLRLGLWVRHPLSTSIDWGWLPGTLFFREMFEQTSCRVRPTTDPKKLPEPYCDDVHLSDGAHFENLGLYELVRRHCRFVIVSDCGDDGEFAFDDFGNAVRRIREDFGVDVQIDLEPLKPNADGLSRQHMVVGTIHYDHGSLWPASGAANNKPARFNDKGTLLYFKPNLTGTEPTDVRQYKTRNPAFPHESTADQFYDEAQWEAYRRLGEYAAKTALSFLDGKQPALGGSLPAEDIFNQARMAWYPTPPDLASQFEKYTAQFQSIGRAIAERSPQPAHAGIVSRVECDSAPWPARRAQRARAIERIALHFADYPIDGERVRQLLPGNPLEPSAQPGLDKSFSALGVYPDIPPLVADDQAAVRSTIARLRRPATDHETGRCSDIERSEALGDWRRGARSLEEPHGPLPPGSDCFGYEIKLDDGNPQHSICIQAAVAIVRSISDDHVGWRSDNLYVLAGLWGVGIGTKFLDGLILALTAKKVRQITVELELPTSQDARGLEAYADLIGFYTRAGFRPTPDGRQLVRWL